jgi:hypothetical protein
MASINKYGTRKWIYPLFFILLTFGCENEQESQATLEFKTGQGYTFQDAAVIKGTSLKVGITATKAKNSFKTYNVSVSYDLASTTITVSNFKISPDENAGYDKDVDFSVRNLTGTEKYYFTIVDADGNLVQKTLTFTVE